MPTSLRPLAYGALALLALAAALAVALMLSGSNADIANAQSSGSLPASKAAVAVDELIALSQSNSADAADPTPDPASTGWVDVLRTQLKTSEQKDLNIIAALQTGVVTDNTVSSKNGGLSS